METKCPHCHSSINSDQKFCSNCGKTINVENTNKVDNPNLIPCPVCKKEVGLTAKTCPHCGTRIKPSVFKILVNLIKNRMTWVVILIWGFQKLFYFTLPYVGLKRWSNNEFSNESYTEAIVIILIGLIIPFILIPAKKEILNWKLLKKNKKIVLISMTILFISQILIVILNIGDQKIYFRETQKLISKYIEGHLIEVDGTWYATSKDNDDGSFGGYIYKFEGTPKVTIYARKNFNWIDLLNNENGEGSVEISFSSPIQRSGDSWREGYYWRRFLRGGYYFEFLSYDVKWDRYNWILKPNSWSNLDVLKLDSNMVRQINRIIRQNSSNN